MHHFICIDSFKGSICSENAARAIEQGIRRADPDATIDWSPVADGGEGTIDTLFANGFEKILAATIDLAGRPIDAAYARKGRIAVIEAASVCGLHLKRPGDKAFSVHTRGVGRLVREVLTTDISDVFLALGGTATTDGGLGFLAELGADLMTETGAPITWQTNPLMETKHLRLPIMSVPLHVLADVTAPYAGELGAAYIFGPQKGLTASEVVLLDGRLKEIGHRLHIDQIKGTGAAGGLGGAAYALGASIESGAAFILRMIHAKERIERADYVWTGEGRVDRQTAMGKLPAKVMALAGQADIPCIVLAGEVTERMEQAWICEAIHDPDEEKMLDSFVTKQRLTRRAEQIVRRLQETEDR